MSASGRRLVALPAAIAATGFVACAIGLVVDPARTWAAYLTAFCYAVTIAAGGLLFHMIGYAASSRWMAAVRRLSETVALPLPLLAVLFVPLVLGADHIYPWLHPEAAGAHERELFAHRAPYFDLPAFAARGAVCFAIWMAAAELLRRWSLRRDRGPAPAGDPEAALSRERALSCALLPLVGLAITCAAFDWIMSLSPGWYSTILGIYVLAGGFCAALALLLVLAAIAGGELRGALGADHTHALGRLLFASVAFWAYCAFFQALLVSIADKPEEVTFYLERMREPWPVLTVVLAVGHFALPFLALLPRRVKRDRRAMVAAGAWLLLMHLVDVYWLIMPQLVDAGPHWLDLAALAAVLGSAAAFAGWRARGVSLLARGDPLLAAGLAYRSRS